MRASSRPDGKSVLEEVHSPYDVQLGRDGLLVLTVRRGLSVGAELAQHVVDHLFDVAGDRRVAVLLKMAGVRWVTPEARLIADTFTPCVALAVLGNGAVDRVLASFFVRIFAKDDFPTRYFDDEAEARQWLAAHAVRLATAETE
jgi:hypothetical protein